MTIIIEPYPIPEKGVVELNVQRSFEIKVTTEEARGQVRWWLRDEVSMFIDADPPTFPEKYRPKHIPPAPQIILDEEGLPVVIPANL